MKDNKLSKIQRSLVLVSGIFLTIVFFVPLWYIHFVAPQYPEGLNLYMHPNRLEGDVEIINGLNHYIGMKTLHTDDFIEFTILPYLLGFFVLFCLITFIVNRKKILAALFWAFALFGVVAMVDFYRWEYNYGHNLDPAAPIQVPDMSYTPPLIGYKQLLNFDVWSYPHIGGSLFFATGIILLIAYMLPGFQKRRAQRKKRVMVTASVLGLLMLAGCSSGPRPINLGQDGCDFCKMIIVDRNFGAEIITDKGKVYKFDDTFCMSAFRAQKMDSTAVKDAYIVNFMDPHNFINVQDAILIKSDEIHSPMGGNIAAFDNADAAEATKSKVKGEEISVQDLYNIR